LRNVIISLALFSLPIVAQADERPVFIGLHVPLATSSVFSTPEHRRHVVGLSSQLQTSSFISVEDPIPVSSAPLAPLHGKKASAQRLAYKRYCDLGVDMTDEDLRIVMTTEIPSDLSADCNPPK